MAKVLRVLLVLSLVMVLGATLFSAGFIAGHLFTLPGQAALPGAGTTGPTATADTGTPADLQATFAPFWQTWDLVHQEYVDQPVDDVKLMQGAIGGMLRALDDPHTAYMDPASYQIATTDQTGELEGIGAEVEAAGDYVRIVSPLPGSPAEAAGILPGDLIVKVDNVDITGMPEMEVISRVRGKAGTTVHLTIQRKGTDNLLEFDIVRAKITISSVESKLLDSGVAYLKINDFGEKTTGELKTALRSLLAQNPKGIVLDLRGNPGGFLDTAIEVTSQFIADGVVMREQYGDGRQQEYQALRGGLATDIPLVVLINKGSASASEIVAGAIQDRQRGTIVGEQSYGKGSVQNWHELQGNNGGVRITIARWLTPNGRTIHKVGITPDVPAPLTEEDHAAGRDPQLDKAVDILLGR